MASALFIGRAGARAVVLGIGVGLAGNAVGGLCQAARYRHHLEFGHRCLQLPKGSSSSRCRPTASCGCQGASTATSSGTGSVAIAKGVRQFGNRVEWFQGKGFRFRRYRRGDEVPIAGRWSSATTAPHWPTAVATTGPPLWGMTAPRWPDRLAPKPAPGVENNPATVKGDNSTAYVGLHPDHHWNRPQQQQQHRHRHRRLSPHGPLRVSKAVTTATTPPPQLIPVPAPTVALRLSPVSAATTTPTTPPPPSIADSGFVDALRRPSMPATTPTTPPPPSTAVSVPPTRGATTEAVAGGVGDGNSNNTATATNSGDNSTTRAFAGCWAATPSGPDSNNTATATNSVDGSTTIAQADFGHHASAAQRRHRHSEFALAIHPRTSRPTSRSITRREVIMGSATVHRTIGGLAVALGIGVGLAAMPWVCLSQAPQYRYHRQYRCHLDGLQGVDTRGNLPKGSSRHRVDQRHRAGAQRCVDSPPSPRVPVRWPSPKASTVRQLR